VFSLRLEVTFSLFLVFSETSASVVHLHYHSANSDVRIYLKFSKTVKGVNLSIFNPDSPQMIHENQKAFFLHSHHPVISRLEFPTGQARDEVSMELQTIKTQLQA